MTQGTRPDRPYFRRMYRREEDAWSQMHVLDRRTAAWIRRYLPRDRRGQWVLDLGCGRGRITELFDRHGFPSVGLDYLPDPLRTARRRHPLRRAGYLMGEALSAPFRRDAFTVVVDYGFLHHVRLRDWPRYRRQLNRLLRVGGWFLTSVFATEDDHVDRGDRKWVRHRGHYDRFFAPQDLREVLGRAFRIRELATVRVEEHVFLHALAHKTRP